MGIFVELLETKKSYGKQFVTKIIPYEESL